MRQILPFDLQVKGVAPVGSRVDGQQVFVGIECAALPAGGPQPPGTGIAQITPDFLPAVVDQRKEDAAVACRLCQHLPVELDAHVFAGQIAAVLALIANQGDIAKFGINRAGVVGQRQQGFGDGVLAGDDRERHQKGSDPQQAQRQQHRLMEQLFRHGIAGADEFKAGRAHRKDQPPHHLDEADR